MIIINFRNPNNKNLIIILLIFILLIIIVGLTINYQEILLPEKVVKDITAWVQGLVNKPVTAVTGFFADFKGYQETQKENKELKERLKNYEQLEADLLVFRAETERLEEMLDYKTKRLGDYELLVAKVIARSPDKWNNMLVIDKGSQHGLEVGMTVITGQGFVGKVYKVGYFSANVQLITDTSHNSFVFAQIHSEPNIYAKIEGYDKVRNLLRIKQADHEAKVNPGTYVTTSSLGGVFPDGIIIGIVTDVIDDDESGLNKTIYVKPSVDLYHLEELFIITDYEPVEAEDLDA
ncbi:MAG: rod shape-determining protein MreC [Anaerovoracaceae bacterium]